MTTSVIRAQITPAGLLIPRAALYDWQDKDIEVVRDGRRIIIQPKSGAVHERERVLSVLETAGLLLPQDTLPPNHKSAAPDERTELGRKFNEGRPLYDIVIEERDVPVDNPHHHP